MKELLGELYTTILCFNHKDEMITDFTYKGRIVNSILARMRMYKDKSMTVIVDGSNGVEIPYNKFIQELLKSNSKYKDQFTYKVYAGKISTKLGLDRIYLESLKLVTVNTDTEGVKETIKQVYGDIDEEFIKQKIDYVESLPFPVLDISPESFKDGFIFSDVKDQVPPAEFVKERRKLCITAHCYSKYNVKFRDELLNTTKCLEVEYTLSENSTLLIKKDGVVKEYSKYMEELLSSNLHFIKFKVYTDRALTDELKTDLNKIVEYEKKMVLNHEIDAGYDFNYIRDIYYLDRRYPILDISYDDLLKEYKSIIDTFELQPKATKHEYEFKTTKEF